MNRTMKSVLHSTGYLSESQLMKFYQLSPQDIMLDKDTLWYHKALWTKQYFHKGKHPNHRALCTETYYAWAPYLDQWTLEDHHDTQVRPDALIRISGQPRLIALEIDTGKETARQWSEKLSLYYASPREWHILVVADGKALRLSRLRLWLEASPRPWTLVPRTDLTLAPPTQWQSPKTSDPAPASTPSIHVEYWLNNVQVDAPIAHQLLATGRVRHHGEEYRHRTLIYHLIPMKPINRWRKLRRRFPASTNTHHQST